MPSVARISGTTIKTNSQLCVTATNNGVATIYNCHIGGMVVLKADGCVPSMANEIWRGTSMWNHFMRDDKRCFEVSFQNEDESKLQLWNQNLDRPVTITVASSPKRDPLPATVVIREYEWLDVREEKKTMPCFDPCDKTCISCRRIAPVFPIVDPTHCFTCWELLHLCRRCHKHNVTPDLGMKQQTLCSECNPSNRCRLCQVGHLLVDQTSQTQPFALIASKQKTLGKRKALCSLCCFASNECQEFLQQTKNVKRSYQGPCVNCVTSCIYHDKVPLCVECRTEWTVPLCVHCCVRSARHGGAGTPFYCDVCWFADFWQQVATVDAKKEQCEGQNQLSE